MILCFFRLILLNRFMALRTALKVVADGCFAGCDMARTDGSPLVCFKKKRFFPGLKPAPEISAGPASQRPCYLKNTEGVSSCSTVWCGVTVYN
jgi:hypothetical protein